MEGIITKESYAHTKNVIYQLYPALLKLDDKLREEVFDIFGKLSLVARDTYLCPNDADLSADIETLKGSDIMNAGLQEKYKIDDELLKRKHDEYRFFEFNKILNEHNLIEESSVNKFSKK